MRVNLKIILLIFIFFNPLVCFSQTSERLKKDSIMDFLVKGLWIQYEIEKGWHSKNVTTIEFTSRERNQYYKSERLILNNDTLFVEIDKYANNTAKYFEKKTGKKRGTIHKSTGLIKVLDKKLIEYWIHWYQKNKEKVKLKDLQQILNEKIADNLVESKLAKKFFFNNYNG